MSQSFMETVSRWGRRGTAGTSIAASLAFEQVVHGYGKVRALDGISLAVAPGEVVCLLGLPVAGRRRCCASPPASRDRCRDA